MKIKDKRSAFFMLTSLPNLMSFAYLDEISFKHLEYVRPSDLSGSSVAPNEIIKIDADRPLLFFTTNGESVAGCQITSSSGETYTAAKVRATGCLMIPGIKRGDFVKINIE